MSGKYIITADRHHVRIYRYSQEPGQFTPSIQPVDSLDLSPRRSSYPGIESVAPFSEATALSNEMRKGSRLTPPDGDVVDTVEQLAERITLFMEKHAHSTWDLAANSALYEELVQAIPEEVRDRLNQVVPKDLVNAPPAELREHFTLR